jgi:hypothetical protein
MGAKQYDQHGGEICRHPETKFGTDRQCADCPMARTFPMFSTPADEMADNNPRQCPIFAERGYHLYSARDHACVDCSKPDVRRTDNGL